MSDYPFTEDEFEAVIEENPIFEFIVSPEAIAHKLDVPADEVRRYMVEETDFQLQMEMGPGDEVPSFLNER